jgi:hypothetical protein
MLSSSETPQLKPQTDTLLGRVAGSIHVDWHAESAIVMTAANPIFGSIASVSDAKCAYGERWRRRAAKVSSTMADGSR